jgi:hypothetical protein
VAVITGIDDPPVWAVPADGNKTHYGVEIENKADVGFFPSMVFFDCSTFEISECLIMPPCLREAVTVNLGVGLLYVSHTATAAPLLRRGSLPLNYGQGMGETLIFEVEDEQEVEIGFVKVYFSTERVDLSMIGQNALDCTIWRGLEFSRGPRLRWDLKVPPIISLWDEITLPVQQSWYLKEHKQVGL